jgi:ribulose 1,5-bisphosphate synthetase/thiazole synthase
VCCCDEQPQLSRHCTAGLSAARQLRNHGYKVVVLEGAERPGGRVHTHRMEVGSHRLCVRARARVCVCGGGVGCV